ncbi:hypothetical protein Lalb_Chr02g0142121 [Lupinus albus]|uniref:Uncharacterized protein n=1 Tax=Lupinus albus TaxID=3870 RepID=A0A6A4QX34_LUPAL|nr:hypothetical protein Lalb_Chr02g0142121 [Lupinus albus]
MDARVGREWGVKAMNELDHFFFLFLSHYSFNMFFSQTRSKAYNTTLLLLVTLIGTTPSFKNHS